MANLYMSNILSYTCTSEHEESLLSILKTIISENMEKKRKNIGKEENRVEDYEELISHVY